MPVAEVDGLEIAYDVVGSGEETWTINAGGRYSKDYEGIREMAEALAAHGRRVIIWDRPNCGASSVCFAGASETEVHADALAGLLRTLDLAPAVITGGSAGSRSALATVARHPDVATGLALWLVSGGVYGLMSLACYYYGDSFFAAYTGGGMDAVVELTTWQEVLERNPANRARMLDLDPKQFAATMERWMAAYSPSAEHPIPGLTVDEIRQVSVPTLVFRNSDTDPIHSRATSDIVAELIPQARLVEPPWGDLYWRERFEGGSRGESWCGPWPVLVPALVEWGDTIA
jgi:pimeloyl-ACP methyl ester carboxylesterase